ncbi:MAG: antibiotic biosynthesis monooxygenase, partial [Nitrososphaerales archaeon]
DNHVQWIVVFAIENDKLDDFKSIVQEITRIVKENEVGTKSYQWFFNDLETECVITEWYQSPEAALAHLNGEAATRLLPKLRQVSRITRLEIYGEPGEEVKRRLIKLGGQTFHFFAGFAR